VPLFFPFFFTNFLHLATSKAKEEYSLENSLLEKEKKKKKTWPNFQGKKNNWVILFFHIMTEFLVLGYYY
jgi:hypothetical protein